MKGVVIRDLSYIHNAEKVQVQFKGFSKSITEQNWEMLDTLVRSTIVRTRVERIEDKTSAI